MRQVACELDLWQEAFRSVEDIQGLTALGRKAPKPQLMATYYAKLTRIFTVSDAHLYNGCAAKIAKSGLQTKSSQSLFLGFHFFVCCAGAMSFWAQRVLRRFSDVCTAATSLLSAGDLPVGCHVRGQCVAGLLALLLYLTNT